MAGKFSTLSREVANKMTGSGWKATKVKVYEDGEVEFATRAGTSTVHMDPETGEVYARTFESKSRSEILTDELHEQNLTGKVVDQYQISEFGWISKMEWGSFPVTKEFAAEYDFVHRATGYVKYWRNRQAPGFCDDQS